MCIRDSYMTALLDEYGGSVVPADITAAARDSMGSGRQADTAMLASWISEFFLNHAKLSATG